MKKYALAMSFILIIAISYSPLITKLEESFDRYWERKYWEKERPRIEAAKLKEEREFQENNYVRDFSLRIAGTEIDAEIKIKPRDRKSCYFLIKIEPFPNIARPSGSGLIVSVYDSDGFRIHQDRHQNEIKNFTRIVDRSGKIQAAENQYVSYEPISLFDDGIISIGTYGEASKFLKTAEKP